MIYTFDGYSVARRARKGQVVDQEIAGKTLKPNCLIYSFNIG